MRTQHPISCSALKSVLGPQITNYVAEKRSLGAWFETEFYSLRLLDRFVHRAQIRKISQINPPLIDHFLNSRVRTTARSFNHLRAVLHAFFERLIRFGFIKANPVQTKKRRAKNVYQPFIFKPEQAKVLIEAAKKLRPLPAGGALRGETLSTIFTLLYGLGLRIGEVQRLQISDVNFNGDTLMIRDSKFGKSRLLPFGPRVRVMLENYVSRKRELGLPVLPDSPLFTVGNRYDRPLSRTSIKRTFRKLIKELNFPVPVGCASPRPHHLRHSFAVGRLLRWYRQGADLSQRLFALSTYMGHVDPNSTQVYLTITGDLLAEAAHRFDKFAPAISRSPEVSQ